MLRAFRRAGVDADRARGALVHGLRHTFATALANADVSVYTLMKLLGHESMVTSQRYVTPAPRPALPQARTSFTAFSMKQLTVNSYSPGAISSWYESLATRERQPEIRCGTAQGRASVPIVLLFGRVARPADRY